MKKTVLITGASSGIGKATAIKFAQKGYVVIGTGRNVSNLRALSNLGIQTIELDVSDETSIQRGFREISVNHDKIDILVNNAGFVQNGFFEELTLEHLRYQFEVNVFGLIRMTQMVVPMMRKSGLGKIINIGSAGGDFTSPGASAYHASKYAIESFTDGMRQELNQFGVGVVLVKPGGVATNFVENAEKFYPAPIKGNPYKKQRIKFKQMLEVILDPKKSGFSLLTAEKVAETIVKAAEVKTPKTRYKVGSTAKILPLMKSLMSDKAFDRMILKQLKLN